MRPVHPDQAIAAAFHDLLDVLDERRRSLVSEPPEAASPAMAEFVDELTLSHRVLGDRPVREAHRHVALPLVGAADHMRALAHLIYIDPPVTFPLLTTTRSILEQTGQALWLLEGCGARERVRRWVLMRNESDNREAQAWEKAPGEETARARAQTLRKRSHERGEALFDVGISIGGPHKSKKGQPRVPGNEAFAQLAIDLSRDHIGGMLYSLLSAVSHGVSWGIISHMQVAGESENDGMVATSIGHDTGKVALLVSVSVLAYMRALSKLGMLYGRTLQNPAVEQSTRQLYSSIRPYLGDGSPLTHLSTI